MLDTRLDLKQVDIVFAKHAGANPKMSEQQFIEVGVAHTHTHAQALALARSLSCANFPVRRLARCHSASLRAARRHRPWMYALQCARGRVTWLLLRVQARTALSSAFSQHLLPLAKRCYVRALALKPQPGAQVRTNFVVSTGDNRLDERITQETDSAEVGRLLEEFDPQLRKVVHFSAHAVCAVAAGTPLHFCALSEDSTRAPQLFGRYADRHLVESASSVVSGTCSFPHTALLMCVSWHRSFNPLDPQVRSHDCMSSSRSWC